MTRKERKSETREKLIATAREAFRHSGYYEVTFRDLAKRAGVSTGAYFAHWENKAAVFQAAMNHPAPDPIAFAESVIITLAGRPEPELRDLRTQAETIRRSLLGQHA